MRMIPHSVVGVCLPASRDGTPRGPCRSFWFCLLFPEGRTFEPEKQKLRHDFTEFLLHILRPTRPAVVVMGWMWALLIHPSSCTALTDAFLFRKSLHWQQEGDRGGQNPRTQHVHEGNRPAGSAGYLLQRSTDSSGLNDAVGG